MAGAGAQAPGFASSCPLTAGTPGGKSRLGLCPAGEGRRSCSVQLSTDSVNAGRSVPRPTWSTQTAERAGWTPREETHGWCQPDPAALGEAVAWQGLVCAPGEPQVQPS
ncbi:unnamed protein product [Rangifer tarandus platyrhynchus]|uniref:Uncharacterized protein n=1 Tax=Rangifer tarandus platyrhynchus TaxID=3082113 RepID=A0ABN8ZZ36_RANTA|nr:unnamed protein product [Rangifer tarandus platyrhynchus]